MAKSAEATRQRILDAAYELFYRRGFGRVGVDEIATGAAVTKRTLYYHFRSKDELLAAVLEHHHALAMARVRRFDDQYRGSPEAVVTRLFAELARWSRQPGWTGAGFTRLAMELSDLPGHPARAVARRHKAELEAWYGELLGRAGAAAPGPAARQLMLLVEGATALILIHGDRGYASAAAEAARALMRAA